MIKFWDFVQRFQKRKTYSSITKFAIYINLSQWSMFLVLPWNEWHNSHASSTMYIIKTSRVYYIRSSILTQYKRKCCNFLIGCIGQTNIILYAQFMIRFVGKDMITIATKSRNAKKFNQSKILCMVFTDYYPPFSWQVKD